MASTQAKNNTPCVHCRFSRHIAQRVISADQWWSVRHWLWGWGDVEGTVDFHEVCRGQFAVYEGEKHDCWQAFFLNPEIGPEVVADWKTGRKTGSFRKHEHAHGNWQHAITNTERPGRCRFTAVHVWMLKIGNSRIHELGCKHAVQHCSNAVQTSIVLKGWLRVSDHVWCKVP